MTVRRRNPSSAGDHAADPWTVSSGLVSAAATRRTSRSAAEPDLRNRIPLACTLNRHFDLCLLPSVHSYADAVPEASDN